MKNCWSITDKHWEQVLQKIIPEFDIFAPVEKWGTIDYELLNNGNINQVVYNGPKPISPLKLFFLPVKENVSSFYENDKKRIILGVPSCDLEALNILDEIFLKEPYVDVHYKNRRDNFLLIGSDCYSFTEHCHCTTYNVKPYPEENVDITLSEFEGLMHLTLHTDKGNQFFEAIQKLSTPVRPTLQEMNAIQRRRKEVVERLRAKNKAIPGSDETKSLVQEISADKWEDQAKPCVSCGACSAICPTCSCFLLLDKPGFEKVRHMDACQYPAFERVAAGEDPLQNKYVRFKNRYFCKYVWKPNTFSSKACTGCGRCIETCPGKINKNEIFIHEHSEVNI